MKYRGPSPFLLEMTVRHLLTMTSGHAEDSLDVLASNIDNPERAFLAIPIKYKPGSRFVYDNGATYMLSSILASVTGESLLDYLRPRLFEPLVSAEYRGRVLLSESAAEAGACMCQLRICCASASFT